MRNFKILVLLIDVETNLLGQQLYDRKHMFIIVRN